MSCRVEDLEVGQAVVNFASVAMVDVAWWRGKWGAEMRSGVESQLPMEVDNQFGCWTRQNGLPQSKMVSSQCCFFHLSEFSFGCSMQPNKQDGPPRSGLD